MKIALYGYIFTWAVRKLFIMTSQLKEYDMAMEFTCNVDMILLKYTELIEELVFLRVPSI